MFKAIAIISATVILVMLGFFGAIIIHIFEDEERYEHGEKRTEGNSSDRQQDMQTDHT